MYAFVRMRTRRDLPPGGWEGKPRSNRPFWGLGALIGDQACYLQIEKSTIQLEHEEEVPSSQPYPIPFEIHVISSLRSPPWIPSSGVEPTNSQPESKEPPPYSPPAQWLGGLSFSGGEGKGGPRPFLPAQRRAPARESKIGHGCCNKQETGNDVGERSEERR